MTVTVDSVNDAPVLNLKTSGTTYIEDADPVTLAPSATVVDVDSNNFNNGKLTIEITAGSSPNDVLEILHEGNGANEIGVSGSSVRFAGTLIGAITTMDSDKLVVTLNSNATPNIVRRLVRKILFSTDPVSMDGTRTIKFTLTDGDGDSDTGTLTVDVVAIDDDVGPVLTIGGAATVDEGAVFTLNLDDGVGATPAISSWKINWGDGVDVIVGNPSMATHIYDIDGSFSIRATATNGLVTYVSNKIGVAVNNVAPVLTISGDPTVDEGSRYQLDLTASGTTDVITSWSIDWDDGSAQQVIPGYRTFVRHIYIDGADSVTIRATATDDDGTVTTANTKVVQVRNVAPTLLISGAASVKEHAVYRLNFDSIDPGADTILQWTITWGDGSAAQTVAGDASSARHVFADGAVVRTIRVTATDDDGTHSANELDVQVLNVAPVLFISGSSSINGGTAYKLGLFSSDPGSDTIVRWEIDWDDGIVQTVSGNPSSTTHIYAAAPNTYTISATATDEDGTYAAISPLSVTTNSRVIVFALPSSIQETGTSLPLHFTFRRDGATDIDLQVDFEVTGTALFEIDYTVTGADVFSTTTGTVTIPVGLEAVSIAVIPIADPIVEADETVILTIVASEFYVVGSDSVASGTIENVDEICNDGIDNTGNSAVDCADSHCDDFAQCDCFPPSKLVGCPAETNFIFKETESSGVCMTLDAEPGLPGSTVKVLSITVVGGAGSLPPNCLSEFVDTYEVKWYSESDENAIIAMKLLLPGGDSSSSSIELALDTGCTFTLTFDSGDTKRKRTIIGLFTGSSVFALGGFVFADPHFRGPNGERFDFNGQPNAIYNLISARHFVVNAQLMVEGPKVRFMTHIAVTFRNATITFDVFYKPANFLHKLNTLLEPLGARASGGKFNTVLELCNGQRVTITQMHWNEYYFLNIELDVPGCHDDFQGILGQMYQCKFATGQHKFVWNSDSEESFRVATLSSTAAPFDGTAQCYSSHEFGIPLANKARSGA